MQFYKACPALLLVLTFTASGFAQAPVAAPLHKSFLPLPPQELIKFLPAPPPKWVVIQSKANDIFMGWMRSEATREFVLHDADGPAGASPAPPQTTRVRIYDTGYFPAFSGDFDDFSPGKYGAGESLLIGQLQAHRIPLGTDGERLRVSVRRRFIIEIDVHNQPPNTSLTWLKNLDVIRLEQVPDTGSEKVPRPIVTTQIDELNPKNNSSSKTSWMSDEELNGTKLPESKPR